MNRAIDPSAKLGNNCRIGNFVTIAEQVHIGNGVYIGHNVVVHAGARIGENTSVQDHAVIGRQPISSSISTRQVSTCDPICIGKNCIIGSHVVLYAGVRLEDNVMVADLASIREGTSVGAQSIIGRGVLVEYDTIIGQRCKIQTGSHVTGNMIIEDDVFFGGEVHTLNDKHLDRVKGLSMAGPHIKRGARVGGNATILPGVIVGIDAVIGAGAVVTKNVPDGVIVVGVPATYLKDVPIDQRIHGAPLHSSTAIGSRS